MADKSGVRIRNINGRHSMTDSKTPELSRRKVVTTTVFGIGAATLNLSGNDGAKAQGVITGTAPNSTGAPMTFTHPFTTGGAAPKTTVATHTALKLKPQLLTAEAFAPFGQVLTEEGRKRLPINTYGDKLDLYREGFESDQPIEWFIVNGRPRWNGVLFLERHMQLSQTFIPVGGKAFYTVVAAPNAVDGDGFISTNELRAFLVPGDAAIQIHRGTWHENPMPLADNTRLLVTSHANLTLAHQQSPDPKLKALPLDLERRWYKAGGYDISLDV
jgi:ureidoglycolate lyase